MDEDRFADAVAAAYAAASGTADWFAFGDMVRDLVGAQRANLRLEPDSPTNLLRPDDAADVQYLAHYRSIDPYMVRPVINEHGGPASRRVRLGQHVISRDALLRTEYFSDFARPYGLHHMLGAAVSDSPRLPLGLQRDASSGPFTEADRALVARLLPHIARALQMHRRMLPGLRHEAAAAVGLDALSFAVIVVDAEMRAQRVNQAAARLVAPGRAGLVIGRAGFGGTQLSARHRDDDAALRRLVASAAGGGGGAMRVRARTDDVPEEASLAVIVSPTPAPPDGGKAALTRGWAMVMARELDAPPRVPEVALAELYGLTQAEAAVSASLAGGVTAEDVARTRQVSLDTVRAQVRSVLRKTNAANLRDFERILALLSAT